MVRWEGASPAFANGNYEPRVHPSFRKGGWQCHWVYWDEWSGQKKGKGTSSIAEEVLLDLDVSPPSLLSTALSVFGPPGNYICHAFEVCCPSHCYAAHSQHSWPCSGRPLWRPTRNAAGSEGSCPVIKELYRTYQYWPHLCWGHCINFCHQICIH